MVPGMGTIWAAVLVQFYGRLTLFMSLTVRTVGAAFNLPPCIGRIGWILALTLITVYTLLLATTSTLYGGMLGPQGLLYFLLGSFWFLSSVIWFSFFNFFVFPYACFLLFWFDEVVKCHYTPMKSTIPSQKISHIPVRLTFHLILLENILSLTFTS